MQVWLSAEEGYVHTSAEGNLQVRRNGGGGGRVVLEELTGCCLLNRDGTLSGRAGTNTVQNPVNSSSSTAGLLTPEGEGGLLCTNITNEYQERHNIQAQHGERGKNYDIIIFKHNYEVIYSLRNMYLLVNIRSALPLYIKSWCEVISRWQAAFHTCFRAPLPLIWWELRLRTLSHAYSKCGTKRPSCVATRLRCSHCRMYITVWCVNLWTKQTNQTTSLKVAGYRWPWHGQQTFDMLQRR